MNRMRLLSIAIGTLLSASAAQAQLELKAGNFNNVFVDPVGS